MPTTGRRGLGCPPRLRGRRPAAAARPLSRRGAGGGGQHARARWRRAVNARRRPPHGPEHTPGPSSGPDQELGRWDRRSGGGELANPDRGAITGGNPARPGTAAHPRSRRRGAVIRPADVDRVLARDEHPKKLTVAQAATHTSNVPSEARSF